MDTKVLIERIPGTDLYTVTTDTVKVDGLSFQEAVDMAEKLMYGVERKEETEKEA